MSENQNTTVETVVETEGQIDLFTGEVAETELTIPTLEEIVRELTGTKEEYTAYATHKIVNQVFEALGNEKRIPPQMVYNYSSKGMINGTKDMKQKFTADEVVTWVTKYTSKIVSK